MRLAYICSDRSIAVFGTSGRGAFVQEILRALSRRGAEIELFAARLDGDRPDGLENIRLHKLSLFGKDLVSDDTAMLRANRELRRMLGASRGGAFDLILERYSPWSYAGVEHARSGRMPCVLEVTGYGYEEYAKLPEDVRRIARETLEGATHVVAGSREVADHLRKAGIDTVVAPGGIDPDSYSLGARLTLPRTGAFTIGYLGDLDNVADMTCLVSAFALLHDRHPEARLLVEGDGPAKTQMITDLSRAGLLGTACFLGRQPARRIPGVLAAVDIVVAPGPRPHAARIREAMLGGVPVICCAVEDSPVRDHINGIACPAGDAPALASVMDLLYGDRILRMRIGSTARRGVVSDQTWDDIAATILDTSQPKNRESIPLADFVPGSEKSASIATPAL